MVADHLIDDDAQEFLAEFGVEIGLPGQPAQARDLGGIGRWQSARRLRYRDGCENPLIHRVDHPDRIRELIAPVTDNPQAG